MSDAKSKSKSKSKEKDKDKAKDTKSKKTKEEKPPKSKKATEKSEKGSKKKEAANPPPVAPEMDLSQDNFSDFLKNPFTFPTVRATDDAWECLYTDYVCITISQRLSSARYRSRQGVRSV